MNFKEMLHQKIAQTEAARLDYLAQANGCAGAVQAYREMLAEIEKQEADDKPPTLEVVQNENH